MNKNAKIYVAGHRKMLGSATARNPKCKDYTSAKRDAMVKLAGFQTFDRHE